MAFGVKLAVSVAEQVSKLHPDLKQELRVAVREISANPYLGKALQEDLQGFLSFRFKRYRIIYRVEDAEQTVTIYMFGHRRDVYELFSELVRQNRI